MEACTSERYKIGTGVTLATELGILAISVYNIIVYCRMPRKATPTVLLLASALLYAVAACVGECMIILLFRSFDC
jgi:hypothetical protein